METGKRAGVLEGVVFDLFHTLADPEQFRPPEFRRVTFTAGYFGLDPEEFAAAWREETARRVVDGQRTLAVFLAEHFAARGLDWPPAGKDLTRYDREVGRYQDQALRHPVGEAVPTLQALRGAGLRLGLLSNTEERDCRAWARSPLRPHFEAVCFSHETGFAKPGPAAYVEVLRRLGLEAGHCAYVGDGGERELEGARNCGFSLVLLVTARMLRELAPEERQRRASEAHATVESLPGIVPLILRGREGHPERPVVCDPTWYHGSIMEFGLLAPMSTITTWRALAEAFAHRPSWVSISDGDEIRHDGTRAGFLYGVDEPLVPADIEPVPNSSAPGLEWRTRRPLRVRRVAELPDASGDTVSTDLSL